MHGRPVICSDIGGMAEAVTDGVDGLHFAVGEPEELARAMVRAVDTEGLWEELREGIPPILSSVEAADQHLELYRRLAESWRARDALAAEG